MSTLLLSCSHNRISACIVSYKLVVLVLILNIRQLWCNGIFFHFLATTVSQAYCSAVISSYTMTVEANTNLPSWKK